jgi:hypothetical protein
MTIERLTFGLCIAMAALVVRFPEAALGCLGVAGMTALAFTFTDPNRSYPTPRPWHAMIGAQAGESLQATELNAHNGRRYEVIGRTDGGGFPRRLLMGQVIFQAYAENGAS